jgi:hypothetical protein
MTIDDAKTIARDAYYAVNPHMDVPPVDFTVPAAVFDLIEQDLIAKQGYVYGKRAEPTGAFLDHMLWHGVRMFRGPHAR